MRVATYASRKPIAFVGAEDVAEEAIALLWGGQWPALRERFVFRTTTEVPGDGSRRDLIVVVDGRRSHRAPRTEDEWLIPLVSELIGAPPHLERFQTNSVPEEPSRTASVRALGRTWVQIARADVDGVRVRLEERYPTGVRGARIKRELFGQQSAWWRVEEREKVRSLLGSPSYSWDVRELGLRYRVAAQAKEGRAADLAEALTPQTAPMIRQAFVDGCADAATPEMVEELAQVSWPLAVDVFAESGQPLVLILGGGLARSPSRCSSGTARTVDGRGSFRLSGSGWPSRCCDGSD